MKLEDSFTSIRFSPSKYTWQIQNVLDYLDMMMDEEDLEETIDMVSKHPDIPEAQLALIELYQEIGQPLKFHTGLEKLRREYPDHIEIKASLARSKYSEFNREDHRHGFEDLFAVEMECLMQDKTLPQAISDRELRLLLLSLAKYFLETGNKNGCDKIFSIAVHCDQDEIRESVACVIKGKDFPMGGTSVEVQMAIEDWVGYNLEALEAETIKGQPNNDLFYSILNKPASSLNADEIDSLAALGNKAEVEHDVIWLLCQGLMRTRTNAGECGQDYFLHALFLTAHFDLTKVAKILWQIWTGIPEQISERMVGDVGQAILGPAVQKLGMSSLDGFYEMLTFNETEDDDEEEPPYPSSYDVTNNFWYSKSMILHALAALAASDYPQKKDASDLLQRLWNHYAKQDDELLGWLGHSIFQFGHKGFDQLIAKAYQENKIDQYTHGTLDQFTVPEKEHTVIYQPSKNFSHLNDYYAELQRIEAQFATAKKLSIEKQIDETIKEVERKTKIFEESIQESLYEEESWGDEELDYSMENHAETAPFSPNDPLKKAGPKVGRNDPCPCGSGKKYKKCCLLKTDL